MRIQNNIQAMNAYRYYNINSGSLSKNLEKLSSGYRINRAGDDAAGLAISEKMRAQVSGLNTAQRNVKDGVSLIKVAEGAMQEIQDMLNRMDTLATQSANGTYQDEVDRQNLQKEVQAVKKEIDRIAGSANFNGIRLLDGSLRQDALKSVNPPSAPAAPEKSHDEILDEIIDEIMREEEEKGKATSRESIRALMLSRTGTRAGITPAKKTVLTFDFNQLEGTYSRGDSIKIQCLSGPIVTGPGGWQSTGRTMIFGSHASGGDIYPGYRTGRELAAAFKEGFKDIPGMGGNWTVGGQEFTWSIDGTVLTVEQKNPPEKESEVVGKSDAEFLVTVERLKPSEVIGTPKADAAFGDKATINAPTQTEFDFRDIYYNVKGKLYSANFDSSKLVDEMRRKGQTGKTPVGQYAANMFRIFYDDTIGFFVGTTYDGQVSNAAIVTDENGNLLSGAKRFPKAGESIVLDFGEIGKIKIVATADFSEMDFKGGGAASLWVITPAASANGGSIAFNITDDQRKKLVDRADALGVCSPDSKNPTPVDITMQWNTDHFELFCGGKVLASSMSRDVKDTTDVTFYIDPSNASTAVATAKLTKHVSATDDIGADAFAGGVSTGLQFKAPDKNIVQKTTKEFQFTPGALAVETPDPDKPTPPGPGKPDKPDNPGKPGDPNTPGGTDRPDGSGNPYGSSGGGKGLILQIGDTSARYDRLEVFIGDMHVKAMGTRDKWGNVTMSISQVDIGTQSGAQAAISVIRDAINYVSGVRGDLGAYQNRLEHTANNLGVMTENIQDAESSIRDTDMAQEMMAYTKNNILIQSAQAMLAQANQLPQGVLRLVQ